MSSKKEFGDFQTPDHLATKVVVLVDRLFGSPERVVEPTAGRGAFLKASLERWGDKPHYEGYEINRQYVEQAAASFDGQQVKLFHRDFFAEDWKKNLSAHGATRVLVIGNPPWVTNSGLGQLRSKNLPRKANLQGLRGLDARTGKSNFDIAEWMLMRLIEALPREGMLAMLCKTMTARKVLRHFWRTDGGREGSRLFHIDAKSAFGVAVDACLFVTSGKVCDDRTATICSNLDLKSATNSFGLLGEDLVSDVETYERYRHLDGGESAYTWRSGIKHDAAKVMEFSQCGKRLLNGLGEFVDLEKDFMYPLLKSSDLGNGRVEPRKFLLVTQMHTGENTAAIKDVAPRTWDYLLHHQMVFNQRRSSIYRNRPRFSIFGVGPYSFAPWKIAISGLYKQFSFVVIPPVDGRPVMVDDTCYCIPCECEEEARLLCEILSSNEAREFLRSLVFIDSKRPITIDVLRRLSLLKLAADLGRLADLEFYVQSRATSGTPNPQMLLFT